MDKSNKQTKSTKHDEQCTNDVSTLYPSDDEQYTTQTRKGKKVAWTTVTPIRHSPVSANNMKTTHDELVLAVARLSSRLSKLQSNTEPNGIALLNDYEQRLRRTPPMNYPKYQTDKQPLSADHIPVWDCSATYTDLYSGKTITAHTSGRTKHLARTRAADAIITAIESPLMEGLRDGWIKDLTCEGIEPNPGPGSTLRNVVSFSSSRYVIPAGANVSLGTIPTPGVGFGAHHTFTMIDGGSAAVVYLNVNPTSGVSGGTIDLTLEQPYEFAMPQGSILSGTLRADTGSAVVVRTSAIVADYQRVILNGPSPLPVSGTVAISTNPLPVSGTVAISTLPTPVAVDITNPTLNINGAVTSTVTSLPQPLAVTGTIDANITNASLPIELATGSELSVGINEESLPIWVTDFGPARRDVTTNLLQSGDIEANPGPATVMNLFEPTPHLHEGIYGDVLQMGPPTSLPTQADINDWTEEKVKARVISKCELAGKVGDYFQCLAYTWGITIHNSYAILTEEIETIVTTEDVGERDDSLKPARRSSPPRPATNKDDVVNNVKTTTKESKPAAPKADISTVVSRIVTKLAGNMKLLPMWLTKTGKTRFKRLVLDSLFGQGWESKTEFNQYELYAYGYIENVPNHITAIKMLAFDTEYIEYSHLFVNFRADLEAAKLHNKEMHAFNGNVLSDNMQSVDSAKGWKAFIAKRDGLPVYTGIEAQVAITNVDGDQNPNQTNLFYQDRLRANMVDANNDIISNTIFTIPTSNVIPRRTPMLSTDGAEIVVDDTLTLWNANVASEVNIAEYYNKPIQPTNLSTTISDQVANNQSSNWRRDNTSMPGFSSFDLASLNTTLTPKGLSLEAMLLKIDMMHSIASIGTDYSQIPQSVWSVYDPSLEAEPSNATLSINDSPVPTENCGGNDPQFPWFGGKGELAFHLTIQSVPLADRNDCIFMPTGLLQASEDAQLAAALFVMSWAEWPFGLYTLNKRVRTYRNGNRGNYVDAVYMPVQTLTRVPGMRRLNIVLPRRYAEANPTTQQMANAQAMITPTFGDRPTIAVQAGTPINISYVGAAPTYVALTDYLYSWALQFDITSIKQYLGRMTALIGIKDALHAVREMNVALCQTMPVPTVSDGSQTLPLQSPIWEFWDNPELFPVVSTTKLWQPCYSNHVMMTPVPNDDDEGAAKWPIQANLASDFRVFETNIAVWNKVVTGLAMAENIKPELQTSLPIFVGDARSHFWERLSAIPMFAAWAMYYAITGLSALGWDNGYTTSENKWIQNRVRHSFCTTHSTGTILPAKYGAIPRRLMENTYQRSPVVVETSVGTSVMEMTHFDRWLPGGKYAKPIRPTFVPGEGTGSGNYLIDEYNGFTPVLLPDIWLQYMARDLPKMFASFPPPMGTDSTQGYGFDANLAVHRNNQLNIVGPYTNKDVTAVFPITEGPNLSDEAKWNNRLWFTTPTKQILNYSGAALIETYPPSNQLPCMRFIPPQDGETQPTQNLQHATYCLPDMAANGSRIMPYLTIPQSIVIIKACTRAARLERAAVLIQNVYREAEIQAIGIVKDIFDDLINTPTPDFSLSTASDTVLAPSAETVRQAVDVAKMPSSNEASTPMVIPAPPADSLTS